jgi:ribose transport system substrate-binding protein
MNDLPGIPPEEALVEGRFDRRAFLGAAAAAGVAIASGPASAAFARTQTHYVIGIGLPFRTSIVYKPLLAGFKQGAKETGSTFLQSSSADNIQTQLADFNAWIGRGVNAITMFPLSQNALAPVVKKAHAKGIKVVGYAVPVPGQDGSVTFDHRQGSRLIGHAAATWIQQTQNGAGKVAVLDDTTDVARARLDPSIALIKQLTPNSTIVSQPKVDPPLTQQAFQAAQSILQANPDVNMFLCVDDDEALGVHQAVKASGRKPTDVWISGLDGSLTAMQQLLNGEYVGASAALPLKEIGRQAVRIPVNILKRKGPKAYVAEYLLVTNNTPALAKKLIADYGK